MTPVTPKALEAAILTGLCFAFRAVIILIAVFSPPPELGSQVHTSSSASSQPDVPARFSKLFSSPSSETAASDKSAARLYKVTAYCPGACCCGKWADGYTASGVPAVGKIVAAPSTIPYGTVLDIPGYGVASVQDRGGAISGNKLDVLFPTHEQAKQWGVQELKVRIE